MGKKNTPNPDAQWDPYHAFPFVPVAIFHRYNVDSGIHGERIWDSDGPWKKWVSLDSNRANLDIYPLIFRGMYVGSWVFHWASLRPPKKAPSSIGQDGAPVTREKALIWDGEVLLFTQQSTQYLQGCIQFFL